MKKKKGPTTEALEGIWSCIDQMDDVAMKRHQYIKLLNEIVWNLKNGIKTTNDANVWQALGLAKGALFGLGEKPE